MNDQSTIAGQREKDERFSFGENWSDFLSQIDDQRIQEAERALQWLLGRERLDGMSFLDIGSGSGLSSLAARRLGARVRSFDYDLKSVQSTTALRDRYFSGDADWRVEQGSVLDRRYLDTLGTFDIVYSWGVLHHTGAMYEAIRNAAGLAGAGGTFAFALYRKTRLCWLWTWEKRCYIKSPPQMQAVARKVYVGLLQLAFRIKHRDFNAYVADYWGNRGMSFQHDIHDWMGGFPYESIRPSEVANLMTDLDFEHARSKVKPYSTGVFGSGCDEYAYRRSVRSADQ